MAIPKYITPTGMKIADELDLLYGIVKSIHDVCAYLDADGSVTAVNFESLCYAAKFNAYIHDARGNLIGNVVSTDPANFVIAGPNSIGDKERICLLYQIFDMIHTLCAKLDLDGDIAAVDYESGQYTAKLLWRVMDQKGNILGNSNYLFRPGGGSDYGQLIDCYYAILSCLESITEKLDADGLGASNYESLKYTAVVLVKVTNSAGLTKGN